MRKKLAQTMSLTMAITLLGTCFFTPFEINASDMDSIIKLSQKETLPSAVPASFQEVLFKLADVNYPSLDITARELPFMFTGLENSEELQAKLLFLDEKGVELNDYLAAAARQQAEKDPNENAEDIILKAINYFNVSMEQTRAAADKIRNAQTEEEVQNILNEFLSSPMGDYGTPAEFLKAYEQFITEYNLLAILDGLLPEGEAETGNQIKEIYMAEFIRNAMLCELASIGKENSQGLTDPVRESANILYEYGNVAWTEGRDAILGEGVTTADVQETNEEAPVNMEEWGMNFLPGGFTAGGTEYVPLTELPNQEIFDTRNTGPYSSDIDKYIKGLNYNNKTAVATEGESISTYRPKDGIGNAETFTVISREKKSIKDNMDADISMINASRPITYPGSLLQGNVELANGTPTPIVTKDRAPVKLTLDLSGAGKDGSIIVANPDYGNVSAAMDEVVAKWAKLGRPVNANFQHREAMVYSKYQMEAQLGVHSNDDKLGVDFKASQSGEKKTMVVAFKQIYYNASISPVADPSDLFGNRTTLAEVKEKMNDKNPPVLVSNVSYGRLIYLKLETTSQDKEVEAAFKAAASGGNIEANAKYKQILENSTFTTYALGGSAQNGAKINHKDLKAVREYIDKEAEFDGKVPAYPISYATTFLRDNALAKVNYSTDYVLVSSETKRKANIHFENTGGYTARMQYSGNCIIGYDDKGNAIYDRWRDHYDRYLNYTGEARFNAPANSGIVYFAFDIQAGDDWPFHGVIPFGAETYAHVWGQTHTPHWKVVVDGVVITEND